MVRFKNARRRWVGEDDLKLSPCGSVAGCKWAAGGGVGFCESVRPSILQVPRDNKWGVSGYCGMVQSKYKTMHRQGVVSYLAEFQSPTVFDHDCNFNHGIIS